MRLFVATVAALVLAALPGGCTADFPDGSSDHQPVDLIRSDGAELLHASSYPASVQNALYSPDGQTIVFTLFHRGYNEGPAGLFRMDIDVRQPSALLDEPDQDAVNAPGTAWRADGGLIAFASDRRDDLTEIWTIEPDTAAVSRVTNHASLGTNYYFLEPTFSPDGEWIVFEADLGVPDDNQQGMIWKTQVSGGDPIPLTGGPSHNTDDRLPNWSPTGDRILFQRRALGSDEWHIFTMTPEGTDVRHVTTQPGGNTDASWSPDGRWICYSSSAGGLTQPAIFVIAADGGEPVRITREDEHEDGAPCWSPDGRWIAFESHRTADEDSASVIRRIRVPGSIAATIGPSE
jgi:TolB protein